MQLHTSPQFVSRFRESPFENDRSSRNYLIGEESSPRVATSELSLAAGVFEKTNRQTEEMTERDSYTRAKRMLFGLSR